MPRTTTPPRRRPLPAQLPNAGRATFAMFGVMLVSAVDAVHAVFCGYLLWTWRTLENDSNVADVDALLSMLQSLALVVGAIGFLLWFRRAYGNAIALGHRASFTPGWAIGAWFVPLLNLVRPYQIASAMWRHAGKHVGNGPLLGFWWAFWIGNDLFAQIGGLLWASHNEDTMLLGIQLTIVADIASVVAGVLAVDVVRKLTRAHEAMIPENAAEVFA
jgi:hypothetical protein